MKEKKMKNTGTNTCRQSKFIEPPPHRRICTSWIVPLLLLWMLPAALGLMMAGRVSAQTFTTLHNFTGRSDGSFPSAGLILSGDTLYGTASHTVFAVNTDGTGFTNLQGSLLGNVSGLILSGNRLYGMEATAFESVPLCVEVFALNIDGTGYLSLQIIPGFYYVKLSSAGLVLSSNTLYGTAESVANSGDGTVFAVNTDSTGFTNLYNFTGTFGSFPFTNSDGADPVAGLVLSGNTLYGTAQYGGTSGNGTVFAVNTDSTGFTNLYNFTTGSSSYAFTINSDGAEPYAGLLLSGSTLYGTAETGGTNGWGTVFSLNTDGTGFAVLHTFTATDPSTGTNSDGANPTGGLILTNNTLYGTASSGGGSGGGTVFSLNTDGTGFTVLHTFTATDPSTGTNSDGANPLAGLVLSGNTLYGTAQWGGSSGNGTVFSIFIQPQLTLIPSGPYMILTWPTNYNGFTLQSTTNLGSSATWTTVSPEPVTIGSQNIVINTTSTGTQQFYRLSQ
jgi:uncharacterized repeat protein (TIGR03803 family)